MTTTKTITIPHPIVAPLGLPITADSVQEVWDTYIKPGQDLGVVQSAETRVLMAILRAVYEGLERPTQTKRTRHTVRALYPGVFMSESGSEVELETNSASQALSAMRHDDAWFALEVTSTPQKSYLSDSGDVAWLTDGRSSSYKVYVGEKLDADGVRALPVPEGESYDILLRNMECNNWTHVVRTRRGNFQPLEEGDLVVSLERPW